MFAINPAIGDSVMKPNFQRNFLFSIVVSLLFPAISLAVPIQWTIESGGNNHYYELILLDEPGLSWDDAKAEAELRDVLGFQGHLVTITSKEENLWLMQTFGDGELNFKWMGAYQPLREQAPVANVGWKWVTGEPFQYTNWAPGEPNDFLGAEYVGMLWFTASGPEGKPWNDVVSNHENNRGYVVEHDVPEPSSGLILLVLGIFTTIGRKILRPRI